MELQVHLSLDIQQEKSNGLLNAQHPFELPLAKVSLCHLKMLSCLHNVIATFLFTLFYILGVQKSIFRCVHQYLHAKDS